MFYRGGRLGFFVYGLWVAVGYKCECAKKHNSNEYQFVYAGGYLPSAAPIAVYSFNFHGLKQFVLLANSLGFYVFCRVGQFFGFKIFGNQFWGGVGKQLRL